MRRRREVPSWVAKKLRRERSEKIIRQGIPSRQVRKFLARSRRDFRCFLRYDRKRLSELKAELPIEPPIWKPLQTLQQACLIIGARERRFAYFNDTGTGKTFLSIALAEYFYADESCDHILVLVPRKPNKYEWADEIEKHSPGTPYVVLEGSTDNKWKQIEDNPDALLFIESYGALPHLVSKLKKKKATAKKKSMVLNPTLIKRLCAFFQGVITDEGVNGGLGNRTTLPWRVCRQLTKDDNAIYFTLTGTPFGRDPILLWAQMWLVDRGYTLGQTQALFRAAFYSQDINEIGGIEYRFLKSKNKLLRSFLRDGSIRVLADEADLPRCVRIQKKVSLPEDAEVYYERARDLMREHHGNYLEQKNAFCRMRQISSGFVGFKDDETGAKASFEFDENPKLDMLLSTVESIDPRYKVIIFHEFIWSGLRIKRALKEEFGIDALHLYGGTKNVKQEKHLFNNDPSRSFLILQNSFAIGLNIQIAKYGIFFESPVSPIARKQGERRVERQHSPHKSVFLYDLITRGTQDERILAFHKQGKDLWEALLSGEAKYD